jgi:nucleoside-diphosphate-sugar epimerase
MRVLITGGGGFVGLALAQALLERGHSVVLFDRRPPSRAFLDAVRSAVDRLSVAEGDVCSEDDIARAFGDFGPITHVFQGAALTAGPERESTEPLKVIDVNLNGTVRVLAAAAKFGVARVVYASSLTVYGSHILGDGSVSEAATPPAPDTLYGITKYAGECTALRLGKNWGLDVRAARIGSVFGPWEGETGARDMVSPFAQVAAAAARHIPVVLPGAYPRREMIYVPDLVSGLIALMTSASPAYGYYNFSANLDWSDSLQHWCEALVGEIPGFQWRYADAGEAAGIAFHDASPRASMDASRAVSDLNWSAHYSREMAMADYARWVSRHGDYFS